MVKNPYPGIFLDIEGIDGAGQTTQVTLVAERLKKEGFKVAVTRAAPKETPIGKLIREVLDHQVKITLCTLEFLFAADHWERQEKEIIPALKNGKIVLADRSVWSFLAYGALEMEKNWLFQLVKNLIFPDLTIFLKVSPRVALRRISQDRSRHEFFEKEKTLTKIWQNYQWLLEKFSQRIGVVDGGKRKEEVTEAILAILKAKLPELRR